MGREDLNNVFRSRDKQTYANERDSSIFNCNAFAATNTPLMRSKSALANVVCSIRLWLGDTSKWARILFLLYASSVPTVRILLSKWNSMECRPDSTCVYYASSNTLKLIWVTCRSVYSIWFGLVSKRRIFVESILGIDLPLCEEGKRQPTSSESKRKKRTQQI